MRWWLIFAVGCGPHSIAAVHPAVTPVAAPSAASQTTACWVEYSRSGRFTASGIAVHGPAGTVLVDAGESTKFRDELREVSTGRFYLKLVPAKLIPDRPASAVLADAAVDPAALSAFVPTHVHSDHLGGLMDLPDLPVRIDPNDLALLKQVEGGATSFNVIPAEARRVVPEAAPLDFVDGPFEAFDRHADLLGDGTVVAVPLEGHTPGSVGVLISAGALRILDAGDAINTRDQLDRLAGKSWILRPTDLDRTAADGQVAVLAALHAAEPSLAVLPAHERAAWVAVFGAPGKCVGG